MSSYIPPLSSLSTHLSQTTSRYTSALRQRLPTTSTSESDDVYITDPDASHLSRVLRAYYKEKSKPLPPWLGPDPRDREKHQVADNEGGAGGYLGSLRRSAVAATSSSSGGGGGRGGTAAAPNRGSGGGGGLGDIWGEGGSQQPQQAEGSLRRTPGAGSPLGGGRIAARKAVAGSSGSFEAPGGGGGGGGPAIGAARPLPSQRAGSYQNNPTATGGGGVSAQDRLRARLAGRLGSGSSGGSYSGDEGGGGRRY